MTLVSVAEVGNFLAGTNKGVTLLNPRSDSQDCIVASDQFVVSGWVSSRF